jgi:hypothetical protein
MVTVCLNGQEVAEVETAHNGHYVTDFTVEPGAMAQASFELEVRKTGFAAETLHFTGSDFARKGDHYCVAEKVSPDRVLGPAFWIATVVFILAYVLIAFEPPAPDRCPPMLGAALMMLISYTIGTINPDFRLRSGSCFSSLLK